MSILLISSCAKRDVSDYNNMYGGAYVMKIRHPLIPRYIPQVGIVTNDFINRTKTNNLVWLEKTDGLRSLLLISKTGSIYRRIKDDEYELIYGKKDTYVDVDTIIDTEKIDSDYLIFDCYAYKSLDLTRKNFMERMSKVEDIVKNKGFGIKLKQKTWHQFKNWNELIKFVNINEYSPITRNKIDGVIIQFTNMNARDDVSSYKLKRNVMNTTDFKLIELERMVYRLYLGGRNVSSLLMKHEAYNNTKDNEYVFSCPFFENCHILDLRGNVNIDTNLYFQSEVEEIRNIILKEGDRLHNKIVELSFDGIKWLPLRIRTDKQYPNSYNVGLSNIGNIFSPPKDNNGNYFEKIVTNDLIREFHELNHKIRDEIFDLTPNGTEVIDLAGGRGGDFKNLISKGYVNIFAIDQDSDALVKYVSRASRERGNSKFYLNVIQFQIPNDGNEDVLYYKLESRSEFPTKFDLCFMNYAIHYIRDSLEMLCKFLTKVLKIGGKFCFSYFDGDYLIQKAKHNLGPFTIEVNIDKRTAKMPLPTIDKSGYREEPLIFISEVRELFMKYGLIEVETYKPCELIKFEHKSKLLDYLSLIRYSIFVYGEL